ncbi:hypothetical protein BTN33_12640 [Aeromonas veronii]|uniref:thioesterase II family protein n=1 Tax=Aeromonas veronii TaxID=654 RepID=UPI000946AE5F|nr:thioesterase domain-containing protein [Aeromonas veronii]OLF58434.1 hypothetical protein BTN33_12640 [Aeromonas veronii]
MANHIFLIPKPAQSPKLRLFCFPFAGGGTSIFQPWIHSFSDDVELVLYHPPRSFFPNNQLLHQDMDSVISELLCYSDFITREPYAFFGHSLGSHVAFELLVHLHNRALPLPEYFIGSGSRAPIIPHSKKVLSDLPHDEFLVELAKLNGTPKEVLAQPELMELLVPVLKADFKIAETYVAEPIQFEIPALILGGEQDHHVDMEFLQAWEQIFVNKMQVKILPGDHFFINEHRSQVIGFVKSALREIGV